MPSNENKIDLKNNIGDTLQLQFSPGNVEDRFYVKLIGFLEGKSILVTTPRENGTAIRIKPDQKFIVRMLSGNSARGFTSSTIHTSSHPYPHLHLSYPQDMESITVRKAERVNCSLIVTVNNEEPEKSSAKGKSSSMEDISTAGAQLTSSEFLGDKGDTITITSKITVIGIEHYLKISGIIRRAVYINETDNRKDATYQYGVEFVLLEDHDKLMLHGFVYEQMMNES